jgi:hypothetical protein
MLTFQDSKVQGQANIINKLKVILNPKIFYYFDA